MSGVKEHADSLGVSVNNDNSSWQPRHNAANKMLAWVNHSGCITITYLWEAEILETVQSKPWFRARRDGADNHRDKHARDGSIKPISDKQGGTNIMILIMPT